MLDDNALSGPTSPDDYLYSVRPGSDFVDPLEGAAVVRGGTCAAPTRVVRIVVTSLPDCPSFLVAKANGGAPRREFIASIALYLFGLQSDGNPHHWDIPSPVYHDSP
jgi:hypothetical protein